MGRKAKDITGMVSGLLTAIAFDHKDELSKSFWKCKCECGTEKVIRASSIISGQSKSCGCAQQASAMLRKSAVVDKYTGKRNNTGHRIGQGHHRAKLTDAQVQDMRDLYESWKEDGANKGYGTLAEIFGCSMWTARDIVTYRTRYAA